MDCDSINENDYMASGLPERFEGIKGVLFDYGGTLDTGGDHWSEVIWRAWQEAGVTELADVGKDLFREAYVYAERELARVRHIMPEDDFYQLLRKKMRIEFEWLASCSGFPSGRIGEMAEATACICDDEARRRVAEARPVLEFLAARYPLALVSNFYGNVESVLQAYGLRDYFGEIIESAVVGVRKPDPEIWRLGVRALGMNAEEVLVVGDSYTKDILPALAAGCRAVWIKGKGWTDKEDAQTYPDTISCIADLISKCPNLTDSN